MNIYEQLVWGLKRTQAESVTVRFDLVADIIGEQEAKVLCTQKMRAGEKKTRSPTLTLALLEEAEKDTTGLATFVRSDLLEIIEEVGLPTVKVAAKVTALQRLNQKMGKNVKPVNKSDKV